MVTPTELTYSVLETLRHNFLHCVSLPLLMPAMDSAIRKTIADTVEELFDMLGKGEANTSDFSSSSL